MSRPCVLGLDLGTSGVKAVLVGQDGAVLARADRGYAVDSPHPHWAETDPAQWEAAARDAVRAVLASADVEVLAVGLDGQMHGTVLVDPEGDPVRPAVLWPDGRATAELALWQGLPAERRRALANPLAPGMTGPVLAWLTRHEPGVVARAHRVLLPKDWLRTRLVPGAFVTDHSDASATLAWDLELDEWSGAVLEAAGIRPDLLPEVVPSDTVVGRLAAPEATAWGLPPGIPVVAGCADAAATLVGSTSASGRLIVTVGSGAQVVLPGITPSFEGEVIHHTYRAADGGAYAMVAVMNAGIALTRVVSLLGGTWEDLYRDYDRHRSVPGFVPFLSGERLPTSAPAGSGRWFGLGLETERADLFAAALEGLCFTIRRGIESMPAVADPAIDVAGGGTRSPVFAQLLADVLGRDLCRVDLEDATAVGSARLAFAAAGLECPPVPERTGSAVRPGEPGPLDERYARFLAEVDR
ncbi:xylulokinase [Aeromicrobium choanae]|uniref:Xylulokinase n=1 Tax=Aeromicrobium choanae TaxID=1736691 RepID=A0A1T4Z372_9ACTN|nr:FGGY family carbohydrate kinase [Aeromicrobium choanae]SKB08313.1 xylulokinase [Aeromicrobium choanae]